MTGGERCLLQLGARWAVPGRPVRSVRAACLGGVLTVGAAVAGCSPVPARFDVARNAGNYAGQWSHRPSGTSGPIRIVVRPAEEVAAATVTVDLGGNLLGTGDPPAVEVTALLDGEVAMVRARSPILGRVDLEVQPDGSITGTNAEMLRGVAGAFTCSGRITAASIEVSCTGTDDPTTVFGIRADRED